MLTKAALIWSKIQ